MIRQDLSDLVFQTELSKWKAVLNTSKDCFKKGQPILIGTATVEKSEFLSDLFRISKIPHQVLNAKPENVKRESEIVAQAGERYAVTIATNMAGRGTDIILGGNPYFKVKKQLIQYIIEKNEVKNFLMEKLIEKIFNEYKEIKNLTLLEQDIQNLPYSFDNCLSSLKELYTLLYDEIYEKWKIENKIVKELGGLFVIGTERHETRRIDNQLRGRSGRQGDPGFSQFFVSLEDELIKVFGGDNIKRWVEYLIQDKDAPLESNLLTKSLENAQQKIELYNYDLRKNVFQYDEVLNTQRKQIFKARNQLLCENIHDQLFLRYSESFLDDHILEKKDEMEQWFDSYSSYSFLKSNKKLNNKDFYEEIWISNDLRMAEANLYESNLLKLTRSTNILGIIDYYWTEHIERMSYIRETISWRSYGQQNPLVEYNIEAFKSFKLLFQEIRSCMLYSFLNNPLY